MEDVGVGDGNLEQEPKNILVIFAAFFWHAVILPQLVISVYPSHELLILGECRGAAYIHSAAIVLSPLNDILLLRLGVG